MYRKITSENETYTQRNHNPNDDSRSDVWLGEWVNENVASKDEYPSLSISLLSSTNTREALEKFASSEIAAYYSRELWFSSFETDLKVHLSWLRCIIYDILMYYRIMYI